MAIKDRLRRLEGDGPYLCQEAYCQRIVFTETIVHPDGTEEQIGEGPPPLCEACPYREGGGPIRHIEVIKNHGGIASKNEEPGVISWP
jgi:hypothetical protein